jgi:hypothetical protein
MLSKLDGCGGRFFDRCFGKGDHPLFDFAKQEKYQARRTENWHANGKLSRRIKAETAWRSRP